MPPISIADDSAPDKPPSSIKRERRSRDGTEAQIVQGLTGLYTLFGMGILPLNVYDGQVIMDRAQPMAETAVAACRHNPRAMKFLRRLALGSEWAELAVVHMGVVVAIGANHGMVRRDLPAAFNLPIPPEHEARQPRTPAARPSRQEAPQAGQGAPPAVDAMPYQGAPPFGPQASSDADTTQSETPPPGLHITPDIANKIAEQAIEAALRQQYEAMQNGAEGVPRANVNQLTEDVRRI